MGLLVSLFAIGCATPRQGMIRNNQQSVETQSVQSEIARFYNWLVRTHQLLWRMSPYHKTWPERRRVHPKTHKLIPEPKVPSLREMIERLNKLMKDPALQKKLQKNRDYVGMPAGSPSPEPCSGPGVRVVF